MNVLKPTDLATHSGTDRGILLLAEMGESQVLGQSDQHGRTPSQENKMKINVYFKRVNCKGCELYINMLNTEVLKNKFIMDHGPKYNRKTKKLTRKSAQLGSW